jgi:hypothetical protein
MANPASIAFFDAHVLSSQVPRACHGLAAVTLDGAYAVFLSAVCFQRMSEQSFDDGVWGLAKQRGLFRQT